MVLARVESLEGLPEAIAKEYEEITEGDHKGKYQLKVDPVDGLALEDVSRLKAALSKERTDHAAKARELQELKTSFDGIEDPKAAREALEKVAKGLKDKPDVQGQIDAAKRQLNEKHEQAIKAKEARESHLRTEIDRLLIDATAAVAIAEEKGNAELLLPHVQKACYVEEIEVDGKSTFVARVKGDGGPRISSKTGSTDPMGVRELVSTDLKHKFPSAFGGSGASGGGGSGQDRGGDGRRAPVDTSKMSPAQRLQWAREQAN